MPEKGLTLLGNMLERQISSCNYLLALSQAVSASRKFHCVHTGTMGWGNELWVKLNGLNFAYFDDTT